MATWMLTTAVRQKEPMTRPTAKSCRNSAVS
uniref:Uncharacterized protein n=1 Tax=Arundo donax TaxID=35708 RepID=A0A0A9BY49_ARUDO